MVHQIFRWRVDDSLGYAEIAERLNADLDRYPPPVSPDPDRCRDRWARSSVHDLLANPKYSGYMVWNRRATKKGGKFNPPEAWVWSAEPTHEPIVTREMFDAAAAVAKSEQRSRDGGGPNTKHPDTKRSYLLRSFVSCRVCGHRMHGKTRRQTPYYACHPGQNLGRGAERDYPDHPVSIWVREDVLLDGVIQFFSERVFGPRSRELFEENLKRVHSERDSGLRTRIETLEKVVGRLEDAQARLVRSLEHDDDPAGAMFRQIRERMNELERERVVKVAELQSLRAQERQHDPGCMGLLDELPHADGFLESAPDSILRWLFEAFRLEVGYNRTTSWADCSVTIKEDTVDQLLANSFPLGGDKSPGKRSLLVGAPGGRLKERHSPGLSAVPPVRIV